VDVQLVEEWLERAGNCLLVIRVDFALHSTTVDDHSTALLAAIASRSERWHKVELRLSRPHFIALSSVRNHLPLLTALTIFTGCELPLDTIFGDAPQLRTVTLSPSAGRTVIPWPNLTRLTHSSPISMPLSCNVEGGTLYH